MSITRPATDMRKKLWRDKLDKLTQEIQTLNSNDYQILRIKIEHHERKISIYNGDATDGYLYQEINHFLLTLESIISRNRKNPNTRIQSPQTLTENNDQQAELNTPKTPSAKQWTAWFCCFGGTRKNKECEALLTTNAYEKKRNER